MDAASSLADGAAVTALREAADSGSPDAMLGLARALLVGQGVTRDVPAAVELISRAGQLGHAEALNMMATLTAMGVTAPPNWSAALDLLERAAERGSPGARGQLVLLAGADAGETAPWRTLRRAVDVSGWMQAPAREPLTETPRVRLARDFVAGPVCDWLVARARGRMRAATMYDGASKTEQVDPHRTCSDYQFDVLNMDVVTLLVREKIAAATKLPQIAMEPPRIFHYALGQQIKAHYDRLSDGVSGYGESDYLGDRIVTFLLYLNDDYDGGELAFPKTGFQCKGAKGDAIYFAHVDGAGRADPVSLHAGLVITRGEKWVMSQWIHDRPFGVGAQSR